MRRCASSRGIETVTVTLHRRPTRECRPYITCKCPEVYKGGSLQRLLLGHDNYFERPVCLGDELESEAGFRQGQLVGNHPIDVDLAGRNKFDSCVHVSGTARVRGSHGDFLTPQVIERHFHFGMRIGWREEQNVSATVYGVKMPAVEPIRLLRW